MSAGETRTEQEHLLRQEMEEVRTRLRLIDIHCARNSDDRGDAIDQANHTVELATHLALRRSYAQKLKQLERAWARICTGQYGICESCGSQIDPIRLNLVPHATSCVRRQRENENCIHRVNCQADFSRTWESPRW